MSSKRSIEFLGSFLMIDRSFKTSINFERGAGIENWVGFQFPLGRGRMKGWYFNLWCLNCKCDARNDGYNITY